MEEDNMTRPLLLLTALLAFGCDDKDCDTGDTATDCKENACQEYADALCECDDSLCGAEVEEEPTDEQLEACELALDTLECGGDTGGL